MIKLNINNRKNLLFTAILMIFSLSSAVINGQITDQNSMEFKGPEVLELAQFSYVNDYVSNGNIPFVTYPKSINKNTNSVYNAIENNGVIGIKSASEKESPHDNFFAVDIPEDVNNQTHEVLLKYSLYGVEDASQTTKSINNSAVYGGQSIKVNDQWNDVVEYVPAHLVKSGVNEIFFNRRSDINYQYQIKDLSVEIVEKRVGDIFLIDNELTNYNGKIHLLGYAPEEVNIVSVLDKDIPVENGVFEHVFEDITQETQTLTISYLIEGKQLTSEVFNVKYELEEMNYHFFAKPESFESTSEFIEFYDDANEANPEDASLSSNRLKAIGLDFKELRPLNTDVENVTFGQYLGFRTKGLDSNAEESTTIHLKYDESKIPEGYSAKDVKTFAFDRAKREWKVLQLDSVDYAKKVIISKYAGDTDYINGVIKVPEMAETSSFTPTSISDMKYADPTAGIVSIAPPSASNTGAATTGFPIKLPAGRNGMQPSLGVQYSSEAGNGWMGLGWNMSLPAITLDTRWGVPRFDPVYETELYLLNGEPLVMKIDGKYTSPHRSETEIPRNSTGEVIFYHRVESSYSEIVRYGTDPTNYRWEVRDKSGNRNFYGGPGSSVNNNTVIRDESDTVGNITHWALHHTIDPFNNYVRYGYSKGMADINGLQAQYFYPNWIKYTLRSGAMSTYYQVDFKRNDYTVGPSETLARNDKTTNARTGTLMTTNDLLTEVKVSFYNGQYIPIRTYRFDYTESSFMKSQLSKIAEYDGAGVLFYSNTMEYYDDVGSNSLIGTNEVNWDGESISVISTLMTIATSGFAGLIPTGSSLGTSTSSGFSLGLRGGFGFGTNASKVSYTFGGSYNYSQSKQKTKVSFLDINGDGLPDKVFKFGLNKVMYEPNLGVDANGNGIFGAVQRVNGLDELSNTKSRTNGFGVDFSSPFIGAGASISKTKTSTDEYFADVNGDGLPDFISNGSVKFNTTGPWNYPATPYFGSNVNGTQNIIIPGELHGDLAGDLQLETRAELRAEHSQFDHVRVWKAPYNGAVNIDGLAELLIQLDCGHDSEDNTFKLTIERGVEGQTTNATVISTKMLDSQGDVEIYDLNSINVAKGDLLFFRIHNEVYGCGGEVEWNPEIEYANVDNMSAGEDEHGLDLLKFDSREDYAMNNGGDWSPSGSDLEIAVDFDLNSSAFGVDEFSGELEFTIEKIRYEHSTDPDNEGDVIGEESFFWTRTYDPENGTLTSNGPAGGFGGFNYVGNQLVNGGIYSYSYQCYVSSKGNIQWKDLDWNPSFTEDGVDYYPGVTYFSYEDNVNETKYWFDGSSLVEPDIDPTDATDGNNPLMVISHNMFDIDYSGSLNHINDEDFPLRINWVVKEKVGTVTKPLKEEVFVIERGSCSTTIFGITTCDYTFKTENGIVIDPSLPSSDIYHRLELSKDKVEEIESSGQIYSAFYIEKSVLGLQNPASISIDLVVDEQINYTFSAISNPSPFISMNSTLFGITHRGWTQFLHNGGIKYDYNEEGEITNIGSPEEFDGPIDMSIFNEDNDDFSNLNYNQTAIRYTNYSQQNQINSYVNSGIKSGPESSVNYGLNGSGKLTATLGRFGEYNIYDIWTDPTTLFNGTGFVGMKLRTVSKGSAFTGKLPFGAVITSGTKSSAKSKSLNQYVDLNGDRYPDIITGNRIQFTNMHGGLSNDPIDNISNDFIAGSRSKDETIGANIAGVFPNSTKSDNNTTSNETKTNIDSGINTSNGESFDTRQWYDINGDGLSDRVFIYKTEVKVQLNTGYGFSDLINWGQGYIDLYSSTRSSGGIGASLSNPIGTNNSYAAGFGASASTSNLNAALLDVNGDGLPDLVEKVGTSFEYYLNNGTSFEEESHSVFYNGSSINQDRSVSGNIYGSFTFGYAFKFLLLPFKVTFTPTAGVNGSVSEKKITIQDIDGDGLPDVIEEGTSSGDISARLNQTGKTHFLKSVNTPLGGQWTVDYGREGNVFDLPQNKWVLQTISTYDGFEGDQEYGVDHTLTSISYENPSYDRREREFLGFEKIQVNQQNPTDQSTFRYAQSEFHTENVYLKGKSKRSSTYDSNDEVISESTITYNIMNPDSPETDLYTSAVDLYLQDGLDPAQLDHSRFFTAPVKSVSTTYEGAEGLSTEEQYVDYDEHGNLLTYKNLGDTYASSPNDAFRAEMEYHDNVASVYNSTGFVKAINVIRESDGEILRKRSAEYVRGKVSKISTQLNASELSTVNYEYDIFGNLLKTRLDNGYETTIGYEALLHTYPTSVSNSHGNTSTSVYDFFFGIPIMKFDINGHQMRTRIDNRGRIIEVSAPNELGSNWTLRMQYEGEPLVPDFASFNFIVPASGSFEAIEPGTTPLSQAKHHAVTRHNVDGAQNNQLLTVSLVDGLGQPIQLKKTLFANSNTSAPLRWLLNGKTKSDPFGRVLEAFLPTTDTGYPMDLSDLNNLESTNAYDYIDGVNSIDPTRTTYDSKDRVKTVQQPGETALSTFDYSIEDGMFTTLGTNENDQTVKTFIDVRGRKRHVLQNNELSTKFYYNAIGEKMKVKNHQGYETFYKYDLAGRRVEERHPDRGVTILDYDLVGNVTAKHTSNSIAEGSGPAVKYYYDFDRLIEIEYPLEPQNNVTYTYGGLDNAETRDDVEDRNAIGRLYMQQDASGVQGFGYDELGNMVDHLRGVAIAGRHTFWYHTKWEYDSHNRVQSIQYPDFEKVDYNYNLGGELESITRDIDGVVVNDFIISDIVYNDLGERKEIHYGNGTSASYTYDARRRTAELNHQFSGFGLTNKYDYDNLSNISKVTTINQSTSLPSAGQIGGPVSYEYTYDDYNRLIRANGRFTGANDHGSSLLAQEYTLDMQYDLAHNIISKTQTHYQGEVTSASSAIAAPELMPKTSYHLDYGGYASGVNISQGLDSEFGYVQPHAPREIIERPDVTTEETTDPRYKKRIFSYDGNGNQVDVKQVVYTGETTDAINGIVIPDSITLHRNLWDFEDRLRAVDLNPDEAKAHPLAVYTYDAGGQRILRYIPGRLDVWSNSTNVVSNTRDEVMMYPSALVTAKALSTPSEVPTKDDLVTKYTKHYYIGAERISSTIGTGIGVGLYPPKIEGMFPVIRNMANQSVITASFGLVKTYGELDQNIDLAAPVVEGDLPKHDHDPSNFYGYWYHRDHLGSSSYISNREGIVTQHMEYMPFGETLVDEHFNSFNTPYKFNGKELDDETGNYYYGARYYNPKFSVWLSVDPLAEKFEAWSPYNYALQNPINFIDPDGRSPIKGGQTRYQSSVISTYTYLGNNQHQIQTRTRYVVVETTMVNGKEYETFKSTVVEENMYLKPSKNNGKISFSREYSRSVTSYESGGRRERNKNWSCGCKITVTEYSVNDPSCSDANSDINTGDLKVIEQNASSSIKSWSFALEGMINESDNINWNPYNQPIEPSKVVDGVGLGTSFVFAALNNPIIKKTGLGLIAIRLGAFFGNLYRENADHTNRSHELQNDFKTNTINH